MQPVLNQRLITPLGQGIFQGNMQRTDQNMFLVRLPVNEQTALHLNATNCFTPRAVKSGLWLFSQDEVK